MPSPVICRIAVAISPWGHSANDPSALAHGAQAEHEANGALLQPRLIGMRDDRRVHQRGGGVSIFMAEIRRDQPLAIAFGNCGQPQRRFELGVAFIKDVLDVPVARREIRQNPLVFGFRPFAGKRQDVGYQPDGPVLRRVAGLPSQMEWTQDDARRIGMKSNVADTKPVRYWSCLQDFVLPLWQ